MSTLNAQLSKQPKAFLLALLSVFLLLLTGIALEKPSGSLAGKVTLEAPGGFHLASSDLQENRVYAIAMGPTNQAGEGLLERGVWVQPDGRFQLDHLPVGEYSLRVKATGYGSVLQQNLMIFPGEVTQVGAPVHLTVQNPYVTLANHTRVFTTREKPSFWLNASAATHATVKLYRHDLFRLIQAAKRDQPHQAEFSSDLALYKPSEKIRHQLEVSGKLIQTFDRTLNTDQQDWARADFQTTRPLPKGDYLAIAEVENLFHRKDFNLTWFSVTDVGLITKHAPDKTLVRAIDLNTNQPKSGVNISIYDKEHAFSQPVAQGITNADGLLTMHLPATVTTRSYQDLLSVGSDSAGNRAYSGLSYWQYDSDKYRTYFYTERPIYRLGQKVYFRGIVRRVQSAGLAPVAPNTRVAASIENPDGNPVWSKTLATSRHGSFSGEYVIPLQEKTGAYQVRLRFPDGHEESSAFEVEQYRKPEYQVEVTPLTPRVIAGDRFRTRIRATYFFGAPVANARVKYTIYNAPDWSARYRLMPRPSYYGYFDDWESSEGAYGEDLDSGYAGDYLSEGYTQTDENGEAVVEVATQILTASANSGPYGDEHLDRRYRVEAEVTDLSRMSVVASGGTSVTAGNIALFVAPEQYIYRSGDSVSANVTAVDYNGKPVASQKVNVNLLHWAYNTAQLRYELKNTVASQSVETDANGQARISLAIPKSEASDLYDIAAEATDSGGHRVLDHNAVWVSSEAQPFFLSPKAKEAQPFTVKLDKQVYQPGSSAKVLISAPVTGKEGYQAWLTVEGTQVFYQKLVPLDASAKVVTLPVQTAYLPNAYVSVVFVGDKHQYHQESVMLKVSPENHFLRLKVTTDKAKYHPGDKVIYTVQATQPDGKPAANVEVALGVVDESIYSVRAEVAPDIQKFFYGKRENWVTTIASFPEEYSAGPDKIEPRIRKDFKDTAAWFPHLMTNGQGLAKVTLTLPDNLTTWRATARAVSLGNDFGSDLQKITATQDLILRLAMPRFYTVGDQTELTAVVHNYGTQTEQVRLNLSAGAPFQVQGARQQSLTLAPEKVARVSWPVTLVRTGDAQVLVKALGRHASDALELSRPVLPLGYAVRQVVSGMLSAADTQKPITPQFSKDLAPETRRLSLSLSPSPFGAMLGVLSGLLDYPYGCVEQTMSRMMPAVTASQLHLKLFQKDEARITKILSQSLDRLQTYRHPDGAWGWWETDDSLPYMTAYVLEGLYRLKALKQSHPLLTSQSFAETETWLLKRLELGLSQLENPKLEARFPAVQEAQLDLAYMQYVLSHYAGSRPSERFVRYFQSRLNQLPPETVAYLTLMAHDTGNTSLQARAYQTLQGLATRLSSNMITWEHTPALLKRFQPEGQPYTYRFSDSESTALGLRVVATVAPDDSEQLLSIRNALMLRQGPSGWENTKTTATVIAALAEAFPSVVSGLPEVLSASLQHGETTLFNQSWPAGEMSLLPPEQLEPHWQSTMAQGQAIAARNTDLLLNKVGSAPLFYQLIFHGYATQLDSPNRPQGLTLSRKFYRLEPSAVNSLGKIRFRSVPLSDNTVRAGESILMKVEVNSPVSLPFVLLEAPLPSGAEVVRHDPKLSLMAAGAAQGSGQEESLFEGDWGSIWWGHTDILDDKIAFFAPQLSSGPTTFYCILRMEMPGRFQLNPVRLEGMYSPLVQGYSVIDRFQVR